MTSESGTEGVAPVANVFVGRDDLLVQLREDFKNLEKVRGRVVFVAGEAGIGKTTLVERFLHSITSPSEAKQRGHKPSFLVSSTKCWGIQQSGNAFEPFADLLDGLALGGGEQFVEKLKPVVRELGPKLIEGLVPYVGPLLAGILEMLLAGKGRSDAGAIAGPSYQFRRLFEQLSQLWPLVLFIDDLHWASQASIELLLGLAEHLSDRPVLILSTYRPHEIVQRPGYLDHPLSQALRQLRRYDRCAEISLDRLSLDQVRCLLSQRYPDHRFAKSFVRTLHQKTSGIPFFIDQVLLLMEKKNIVFLDTNGRWLAKSSAKLPIPERALDVVRARVHDLDRNCRHLLRYASVLGEQFRSLILAEILQETHLEVLGRLRVLESVHHLVQRRPGVPPQAERPNWAFQHAFVHDALYESLGPDELVEIHGLAVDALEADFPEARDELAGELAHHCEKAKRYQQAIVYRIAAGRRAEAAGSFTDQWKHCRQALSDLRLLPPAQDQLRDEVILRAGLARVFRHLGDMGQEAQVGHELLQLARQHDDPAAEIGGSLALLYVALQRSDEDAVRQHSEQAWRAAKRLGEAIHMTRVVCFFADRVYRYAPEEVKQRLGEAIDACERESATPLLPRTFLARGSIALLENEDDLAFSLFSRAIEYAGSAEHQDPRVLRDYPFVRSYRSHEVLTNALEGRGRIYRRRSEWQQAIAEFRRVYELKAEEKNQAGMAGLLNVIAETELQAGMLEQAEQSFEQSWAIAEPKGSHELKAMVLSTGISIALQMGNDLNVQERLLTFEGLAQGRSSLKWMWHKIQMTRGALKLRAGALEDALQILSAGLKVALEDREPGLEVQYGMWVAKTLLQRKETAEAWMYAERAVGTASYLNLPDLGDACMVAARVSMAQGEITRGRALSEQALNYYRSKNLQSKLRLAKESLEQK